jgi:hypothetical protein
MAQQPETLTFPGGQTALLARAADLDGLPDALVALSLAPPRSVMVLVGGAGGLSLEGEAASPLRELFHALAEVAGAAGATVVDGGTDAGVMALMGQAHAEIGATFPLLGVAAEGTVDLTPPPLLRGEGTEDLPPSPLLRGEGHEDLTLPPLLGGEGHEDLPPSPPLGGEGKGGRGGRGEVLEPHHTHFLLVPGDRWGDESPWIARVATLLAGEAPSVTVLAHGGEISRQDVAHSLAAGRPVLVIAGTGRLADELAGSQERSPLMQVVDLAAGAEAVAGRLQAALGRMRPPKNEHTRNEQSDSE